MTTNPSNNAYGTPLILRPQVDSLTGAYDYTGVPVGLDIAWRGPGPALNPAKVYSEIDIKALPSDQQTALSLALWHKYDSVRADTGPGTSTYNEAVMMSEDVLVFETLKSVGVPWPQLAPTYMNENSTAGTLQDDPAPAPVKDAPAAPTPPAAPAPAPAVTAAPVVDGVHNVPTAHVSLLHELADAVEKGVHGAERDLVAVFRKLFPKK